MSMARPTNELYTVEEYTRLAEDDRYRSELVRGRLVREPRPGAVHARLQAELAARLYGHLTECGEGLVLTDVGLDLGGDPPTVRGPDLAVLAGPPDQALPRGFLTSPPILAVEIVSPSSTATEIQQKALDYLDGGVRLVWVIDPDGRTVTIYRSRTEIRVLEGDDEIEMPDVLAGLSLRVSALV